MMELRTENEELSTTNQNQNTNLAPGNLEPGTASSPSRRRHGSRTALLNPKLSVVMPVFNEIATIDEIIPRVLAVPMSIELIVVDDCSTDGTRQRLEALTREHRFTLLLQERNQGKGAALRR